MHVTSFFESPRVHVRTCSIDDIMWRGCHDALTIRKYLEYEDKGFSRVHACTVRRVSDTMQSYDSYVGHRLVRLVNTLADV